MPKNHSLQPRIQNNPIHAKKALGYSLKPILGFSCPVTRLYEEYTYETQGYL